jgi:uncharacterized protein (DUF1501 family)
MKGIINRRNFFKRCALSTLGTTSAMATINSLSMMNAIADTSSKSSFNDYRALVCVFLHGGNDSHNLLIPTNEEQYGLYKESRQGLAIPREDLLRLSLNDGSDYGFTPNMPNMKKLFDEKKAAILSNVGALVEPTTRETYLNTSVQLPPRLFSHSDQQRFWNSLKTDIPRPTGWSGRMAERMIDMDDSINQGLLLPSMNISLRGVNLWQTGDVATPYTMSKSGATTFDGFSRTSSSNKIKSRMDAFDELIGAKNSNIFVDEYARMKQSAFDTASKVSGILKSHSEDPALSAFSKESFSRSMKMVANVIAARNSIGAERQTFFVGIGGWDTHSSQLSRHEKLLEILTAK